MNGSITLPDIVDYPDFYKVSENKQLFNKKFCYIIEPYDIKFGLSMYVGFRKSDVFTRISDFLSNVIDIKEFREDRYISKLLLNQAKLVNLLKSAMIVDSILYFSKVNNDLVLVDIMISGNKFAGPGMLRDLFSKVCTTQKVSEIKIIDDDVLKANHGKFIKPSRYQYCIENNSPRPLYGIIDEI